MSDQIQQARDVLAHARAASTIRPWATDSSWSAPGVNETHETFESANVVVDMWDIATFYGGSPDDGREDRAQADRFLFLLTTDPDLLDAWDGMLAQVDLIRDTCPAVLIAFADRIAAAIIAADGRMSA